MYKQIINQADGLMDKQMKEQTNGQINVWINCLSLFFFFVHLFVPLSPFLFIYTFVCLSGETVCPESQTGSYWFSHAAVVKHKVFGVFLPHIKYYILFLFMFIFFHNVHLSRYRVTVYHSVPRNTYYVVIVDF